MSNALNIVHVAPEVTPFSESGGLGLVAGALPPALASIGLKVAVITPCYQTVPKELYTETNLHFRVWVGARPSDVTVCEGRLPNDVPVYLIKCDEAYGRRGIYGPRPATDYADNSWRFTLLCRAAIEASRRLRLHPDVYHCHDWPTGLLPMMVGEHAGTVLTIHNLAFHGQYPRDSIAELGLDPGTFHSGGAEFWGKLNFLKGGLNYADRLTTVSPTYAKEIQTTPYGCGLDGVLRDRSDRLVGILNGVDYDIVEPKEGDRAALLDTFGLEQDKTPVLGMVSRLVQQKGIDLIPEAAAKLLDAGKLRLAVLGTGEKSLEHEVSRMAERWPGRVGVKITYSPELARLVISASDALLMPSRYEPCGLTQLFALRYGTLPVVRATGGLADTVVDGKTGFSFEDPDAASLADALERLLAAWETPKHWQKMQAAAKKEDYSWTRSAQTYAELYNEVVRGE